jgi:hypothetical protein
VHCWEIEGADGELIHPLMVKPGMEQGLIDAMPAKSKILADDKSKKHGDWRASR